MEQKISDAGPIGLRVDPHHLTTARRELRAAKLIASISHANTDWFFLPGTPTAVLESRLAQLSALHGRTTEYSFVKRVGQALEIAVFRALAAQEALDFMGGFTNLDAHDDSKLYQKDEPPRVVNGRVIPGAKRLDFLVTHPVARTVGIEVKNTRPWLYPDVDEIRDLIIKC